MTIEPDVEIESGSYNTSNSNLWTKVWNFFRTELKEEWARMRQGQFTLDNLMSYIYGEQISKIPAKLYNEDAEVKYLQFGSLYTFCCHGSKEHLIKRWLKERIAYVDSMLGYFTSQDDQITIRMNKTGYVSFEVTPYIPLYFSVKWSNASGGTQTFKLKRGETKTFYYTSTTSTDQEVIIYHAKYVKKLDNLSNLNPSSCILANAKKLTNVEIHSPELYNINVTGNRFLRNIDLRNCTALGTVTATGSSLDVSDCKYLRYVDVYNTNLTEVQLNTSGGSLLEIYYPKTIQSVTLIKQRLLEKIGLPYGSSGEEIPTSLYNIDIENCPSIERLNTSDDPNIYKSFASMVYCNNLTLRNSLDLKRLTFDGFYRLKNITIENMYNLEELGFNDLLPKGESSTLQYVGLSNCPLLEVLELNCTSNAYEITFANKAILNLGGLSGLKSIQSNCVLKGIETIVVPLNLESMFFTNDYGEGYSTIKNIWASNVCTVNTTGSTAKAQHVNSTYEGIDFSGMNLKNIDLGALVNIPKAINFTLYPTSVNPNFNLNRDGETYPYLQPEGTLDLSNYTESLAKFFDGVDLDKLKIVCTKKLPQTDLSYCFYNSTFSNDTAINTVLSKVSSITNLDYCFYRTTISDTSILSKISIGESSTMNYMFAECPNITNLENVTIPGSVIGIEGMFKGCPLTSITNMTVNVHGSISGLFRGCNRLTTINTLRIPNVTNVSSTFEGCNELATITGFELPESCTDVSKLYSGCYKLLTVSANFSQNITAGNEWYPPNLENLIDTTINSGYVKMTNCTTLKQVNNVTLNNGDYSDMFNGCINLERISISLGNNITGMARFFKGCGKVNSLAFTNIPDSCTTIDEIFSGTAITDISGMVFGSGITNANNWMPPNLTTANNVTIKNTDVKFRNCNTLIECKNLIYKGDYSSWLFSGCHNLVDVTGLTLTNPIIMGNAWGDSGTFSYTEKLTEIDFGNCNLTNVTDMRYLFYSDAGRDINIKNFLIPNSLEYYTGAFARHGYSFTNLTIDSEKKVFNPNNTVINNGITFNGVTITENVKDLSSYFENVGGLKTHIDFPTHITNCENCYKNCTGLTHISSNWNKVYANGITSTDCYSGCTGITHIDDESAFIYEGDYGLDYIPFDWGGNGLTKDVTTIFEVLIPNDNFNLSLVQNLNQLSLENTIAKVNWGDRTPVDLIVNNSTPTAHTYSKAGTYYIKANLGLGNDGAPQMSDLSIFKKILQVSKKSNQGKVYHDFSGFVKDMKKLTYVDCSNLDVSKPARTLKMFRDCSSLETVILPPNMKLNYSAEMFQGCYKLIEIRNYETWDMTICAHAAGMFNGCQSLGNLDVSNWGMGSIATLAGWGVQFMFYNCEKMTYFDVSKWQTSTWVECERLFSGTSIESIDLSNWQPFTKGNINNKNLRYMFQNCYRLTEVKGLEKILDSNIKDVTGLFDGCSSLETIDLSLCDLSKVTETFNMARGCTKLKNNPYLYFDKIRTMELNGCDSLEDPVIDLTSKDTSLCIHVSPSSAITKVVGLNSDNAKFNFDFRYATNLQFVETIRYNSSIQFGYCYYGGGKYPCHIRFKGEIEMTPDTSSAYVSNYRNMFTIMDYDSRTDFLNHLKDYTGTDTVAKLVLTDETIAELSTEQVLIATNKGWTITT